jgi:hypothetical protein
MTEALYAHMNNKTIIKKKDVSSLGMELQNLWVTNPQVVILPAAGGEAPGPGFKVPRKQTMVLQNWKGDF